MCSESHYLQDLNVLVSSYMKPLVQSKHLKEDEIRVIFSNCDMLISISEELLKSIQEGEGKDITIMLNSLGKALVNMVPYFRMYSMYCNNYQNAANTLTSITSENKKFRKFLYSVSKFNGSTCIYL